MIPGLNRTPVGAKFFRREYHLGVTGVAQLTRSLNLAGPGCEFVRGIEPAPNAGPHGWSVASALSLRSGPLALTYS